MAEFKRSALPATDSTRLGLTLSSRLLWGLPYLQLILAMLTWKMRAEERLTRQTFGEEYDRCRQRVPLSQAVLALMFPGNGPGARDLAHPCTAVEGSSMHGTPNL